MTEQDVLDCVRRYNRSQRRAFDFSMWAFFVCLALSVVVSVLVLSTYRVPIVLLIVPTSLILSLFVATLIGNYVGRRGNNYHTKAVYGTQDVVKEKFGIELPKSDLYSYRSGTTETLVNDEKVRIKISFKTEGIEVSVVEKILLPAS